MTQILSIEEYIQNQGAAPAKISRRIHQAMKRFVASETDGTISLRLLTDGLLVLGLQTLNQPVEVSAEIQQVLAQLQERIDAPRGSGRFGGDDPKGAA